MSKTLKYVEFLLHSLFWITPFILVDYSDDLHIGVFYTANNSLQVSLYYSLFFHALIFYCCLYIILLRFRKSTLITLLFCIGIYSLATAMETWADMQLIDRYFFDARYSGKIMYFLGVNLLIHLIFLVLACSYGYIKIKLRIEKNEQILSIEKLDAELKFLKMQINPHFLFNTLNNLYGMARKENALMVADGITKLSILMRYMIYEGNADLISLQKEVEFIKTYIEIQKMRFLSSDDISILFTIEGTLEGKTIPPLLLVVLVENAFKHGTSIEKKSMIEITLSTKDDTLNFCVRNTKHNGIHNDLKQASGFGLKNLKRRLDYLELGKYDLSIKDDNNIFTAILQIRK